MDLYTRIEHISRWLGEEGIDAQRPSLVAVGEDDSPEDLPSTILSPAAEKDGNLYIWRKANAFAKRWLPRSGYAILESAVFEDCIGYRCERKSIAYTVFLYACGKERISPPDGECCSKLREFPFAADSTVLVLCLRVYRFWKGDTVVYPVRNSFGNSNSKPILRRLNAIGDMPILEYFPSKEMLDQIWPFMYAFNHEDTDVYDCLITDTNPFMRGCPEHWDCFGHAAFYGALRDLHQKYGDMKFGYARHNGEVYCAAPYLEGLGYFSWSAFSGSNRMHNFVCHPFGDGTRKTVEFIQTEYREPEDLFRHIPALTAAVPLPPAATERFAAKLFFSNGECRKYVLPVSANTDPPEAIPYRRYVFSDDIWRSVSVVPQQKSQYPHYPPGGAALTFENGFSVSGMRGYLESTPYTEPEQVDEIVYEDAAWRVRKLWRWKAKGLYEDEETGLLRVLLSGLAFNYDGKSTFASVDGERLTGLTFDISDHFSEGRARVAIAGHGYGYIDQNMNLVTPLKYTDAEGARKGAPRQGMAFCGQGGDRDPRRAAGSECALCRDRELYRRDVPRVHAESSIDRSGLSFRSL